MELLILTIAVLMAGYFAFAIAFPKALPNEVDERTQQTLKQIYEENEAGEGAGDQQGISYSLEQESPLVRGFFSLPFFKDLYSMALKAGLRDALASLVLGYVALSVVLLLLLFSAFGLVAALAAPVVAFLLLRIYLKRKIKKRNTAFLNTFPDVLDMFVRSIRSGFPIASAFKLVAENMEPPASTEFERVVNELSLGQSIESALSRLAERIDEPDVRFFVVVMKVQQKTGGNLAEVVSNLSNVIRKRKQLRLKIRALVSEGKATSYILGALPLLVFSALYVVAEDYISIFWTQPSGMIALAVAIGLIVGCMALVNKMIAIDI